MRNITYKKYAIRLAFLCIYVAMLGSAYPSDAAPARSSDANSISIEDARLVGRRALRGYYIEKGWEEIVYDYGDKFIYTFRPNDGRIVTGGLYSVYIRKKDGYVLRIALSQ